MYLSRIEFRHFRNLGRQELEIPSDGVALVGANAQGKSNFLEGLYYLETFRSFRGARDDQLVAFGEDAFRVAATLLPLPGHDGEADEPEPGASGCDLEVAAGFQRRGRRKKVTVDGVEPERIGDALGRLSAVLFSPGDVAIVSEGPSERRRFLDIVLSLNRRGYLGALQIFRQVLSRRNATLKGEGADALVQAWNDQLVESGARVIAERRRWIETWGPTFRGFYEAVSGGVGAELRYRPNVELGDATEVEEIEEAYREALTDSRETERRTRTTMVGPQRDDFLITLEGDEKDLDVRDFGSGGQRRTAALALRLAEAATIREARGRDPLVLLDDVFAELDPERSERILALIEREETGQVIVTAPKESDVRIRTDTLARWRIRDGRVET